MRVFHWFQALLQQDCRLHASWWWWWWTALHWWWHCYPPRAESAGVGFTCLKLFDVVGGSCLMESGSVGGGLKIRIRCLFFCQHLDFCRSLYTNILHSRIKARRCMCQRYRSYICVLYCAAIDAVRQAEAGSTSRFRFSLATIRVWTRVIDITACVRGDGHILIVYISSLYLCITPASKTLPLPPPIITHHHTGRPLLACPSHRQRHLPIRH